MTMSDRLARTQDLFRIWNSGDVEALVPHLTEDFEWVPATIRAVEGGSFHGVDGFRTFFEEWGRTWESWQVEPTGVQEVGPQVLVLGHVHAKGRGSGLELDQPVAYLFEFAEDGRLKRGATFFDHEEAKEEARSRAGAGEEASA